MATALGRGPQRVRRRFDAGACASSRAKTRPPLTGGQERPARDQRQRREHRQRPPADQSIPSTRPCCNSTKERRRRRCSPPSMLASVLARWRPYLVAARPPARRLLPVSAAAMPPRASTSSKASSKSRKPATSPATLTAPRAILVHVRVQPGARDDRFAGDLSVTDHTITGLTLHVRAPPRDGAANTAVASLVAKAAGVPVSDVAVVAGMKARDKVVRIAPSGRVESVDEVVAALAARAAEDAA
ncbi:hypothetical protein AMAG_05079 [Allomyces macrogynus ATCC 38327]|uniref:TIGR00251 family protein n=1 Tax=Allomyces macrogynus (strain ATCC 38327) TaxID=578462 RepID=A0A0L0S7F0_ALLM3|nr:hypothetical protein AMAG_05079 [Allomyces macrogynus ATCC 38327]|eukprot:KNE58269.1 hypothetical protein AMAG_05079 [Allomyces macrogynus ATCC 38327]